MDTLTFNINITKKNQIIVKQLKFECAVQNSKSINIGT